MKILGIYFILFLGLIDTIVECKFQFEPLLTVFACGLIDTIVECKL